MIEQQPERRDADEVGEAGFWFTTKHGDKDYVPLTNYELADIIFLLGNMRPEDAATIGSYGLQAQYEINKVRHRIGLSDSY